MSRGVIPSSFSVAGPQPSVVNEYARNTSGRGQAGPAIGCLAEHDAHVVRVDVRVEPQAEHATRQRHLGNGARAVPRRVVEPVEERRKDVSAVAQPGGQLVGVWTRRVGGMLIRRANPG